MVWELENKVVAKCNYLTTQHVPRCASVLFLLFSWSQSTLEWERSVTETKGTAKEFMNKKLTKTEQFANKVWLWEFQLYSNNSAHFSTLGTEKPTDTNKYAHIIHILQQEFSSRFQ